MNVVRLVVEALLSREATWAFLAGLALSLGLYLYGRFRQVKQLTYQIMANSRVGLVPVQPGQGEHGPALRKVLETLRYVSVVVVRFSNAGSQEISARDYDKSIDLRFPG